MTFNDKIGILSHDLAPQPRGQALAPVTSARPDSSFAIFSLLRAHAPATGNGCRIAGPVPRIFRLFADASTPHEPIRLFRAIVAAPQSSDRAPAPVRHRFG